MKTKTKTITAAIAVFALCMCGFLGFGAQDSDADTVTWNGETVQLKTMSLAPGYTWEWTPTFNPDNSVKVTKAAYGINNSSPLTPISTSTAGVDWVTVTSTQSPTANAYGVKVITNKVAISIPADGTASAGDVYDFVLKAAAVDDNQQELTGDEASHQYIYFRVTVLGGITITGTQTTTGGVSGQALTLTKSSGDVRSFTTSLQNMIRTVSDWTNVTLNATSDTGSSTLTWSKVSGPAWLTISPSGVVTVATGQQVVAGEQSIVLRVIDSNNDHRDITVNFIMYDPLPTQDVEYLYTHSDNGTAVSSTTVNPTWTSAEADASRYAITYTLAVTGTKNGSPVTSLDGTGFTFNSSTGIISGQSDDLQDITCTVTLTAGLTNAPSHTVTKTVYIKTEPALTIGNYAGVKSATVKSSVSPEVNVIDRVKTDATTTASTAEITALTQAWTVVNNSNNSDVTGVSISNTGAVSVAGNCVAGTYTLKVTCSTVPANGTYAGQTATKTLTLVVEDDLALELAETKRFSKNNNATQAFTTTGAPIISADIAPKSDLTNAQKVAIESAFSIGADSNADFNSKEIHLESTVASYDFSSNPQGVANDGLAPAYITLTVESALQSESATIAVTITTPVVFSEPPSTGATAAGI